MRLGLELVDEIDEPPTRSRRHAIAGGEFDETLRASLTPDAPVAMQRPPGRPLLPDGALSSAVAIAYAASVDREVWNTSFTGA